MSHPATLAELIEHERRELTQVHAMARCLNDVLMYADNDDALLHADLALVIARLLNEALARLEKVRARVAQLEKAVADSAVNVDPLPNKVREARPIYGASVRNSTTNYPGRGDESEPWLMVRDCSGVARAGAYACKPSSKGWAS